LGGVGRVVVADGDLDQARRAAASALSCAAAWRPVWMAAASRSTGQPGLLFAGLFVR
jgi:hypothetical protein